MHRHAPDPMPKAPTHAAQAFVPAATTPLAGIILVVLSSWALSTLDTSAKWIMTAGAPLLLVVWVRFVVHTFLVLSLLRPSRLRQILRPRRPGAQLLRGVVMVTATFTFFTTLQSLPQAEATSINFLAPLLTLA